MDFWRLFFPPECLHHPVFKGLAHLCHTAGISLCSCPCPSGRLAVLLLIRHKVSDGNMILLLHPVHALGPGCLKFMDGALLQWQTNLFPIQYKIYTGQQGFLQSFTPALHTSPLSSPWANQALPNLTYTRCSWGGRNKSKNFYLI